MPGSKPILIDAGSFRETVQAKVVTLALQLDVSLGAYDPEATRLQLATLCNVSADRVALSVEAYDADDDDDHEEAEGEEEEAAAAAEVAGQQRRRLGSLQLAVTIRPAEEGEGGVEAAEELAMLLGRLDDGAINALATSLGVGVALAVPAAVATVEIEQPVACPLGMWCSVGLSIECAAGTYTDLPSAQRNFAGACKLCPDGATSPAASTRKADCKCARDTYLAPDGNMCAACPENAAAGAGSVSIDACHCNAGLYRRATPPTASGADGAFECAVCPVGTACEEYFPDGGATLATLPLLRGYYRTGNKSEDPRRCPDFGNSSGCEGGVGEGGGEGPCKPWLRGPYCTLCNVSDASRYYDSEESECLLCEGSAEAPLLLGGGVLLGTIFLLLLLARTWQQLGLGRLAMRAARVYDQLSLRAKFKQCLGFYQIATRISSVYEVPMPAAVKQLLSLFEALNINIAGIGLPLQCLSLGTYEQQLAFTMLAPAVLAAGVLPGGNSRLTAASR